jgi:hypothetical protein
MQCCGTRCGIRCLFDPWTRIKKKTPNPESGSGINIPNYISERLETLFWVKILQFFDADPGIFLTLDLRWKKFNSEIRINIPDSQHYIDDCLFFA